MVLKESHAVMATPLHRPPFVAAYGVMMSEMTVRGLFDSIRSCFVCSLRFVEAHPVSLTQDVNDWLICMILTAWGDARFDFLGDSPDRVLMDRSDFILCI